MVAWLTMVWELAVGDTMVLTFIWPHEGTMAEFATMFENGGYVESLSLTHEAPPQTGHGASARLSTHHGRVTTLQTIMTHAEIARGHSLWFALHV